MPNKVFHPEIPTVMSELSIPGELITRLRKRALKSGRLDDANEEVIQSRIRTYEEETKELFDHYPDELRTDIDADQTPVKVLYEMIGVINQHPEWTASPAKA